MGKLFIIAIVLFLIGFIIELTKNDNKNNKKSELKYKIKQNIMTINEQKFIKQLNPKIEEKNLIIIPQIQLQSIFESENITSFNKIKAKSIDFAIVDKNYNYKIFIELDDTTHNQQKRIKRDKFINELFKNYNLKLLRIKVKNDYTNEINKILEVI